jgi:thymidylate synthase
MEPTLSPPTPQKNESRNPVAGDVAACWTHAQHAPSLPDLDDERVAFVAAVRSRSDLESLLRRLHRHPGVRHLVIHGGDPTAAGEALVDLWREGLGADGRLPGARGTLSAELDADIIEALRARIEIWDDRDGSPGEVASRIAQLPRASDGQTPCAKGDPRVLPDPVIPERGVFLSRKTTFPIFSSGVADSWLQLLNLTLRIGTGKQTSEGERFAEALNAVVTIETPVLEDGDAQRHDDFPDYLDIRREDFERRYGPHYMRGLRDRGAIDQLEAVCDRLGKSLDTRSGTLVLVESSDMVGPDVAPNLLSATFNAVDEKLFGTFVLRRMDVYTDWPLEAMALVRLQRETAERLGLEVGSSTFLIHSADLFERDWERSWRVLRESFERPLPLHVDPAGVFLFGNDGGDARAMLLNHDASAIQWEQAFSDPEDLSWYIVDVMPWLMPQHIRYVGQECASLMRAMQEKECYLQG